MSAPNHALLSQNKRNFTEFSIAIEALDPKSSEKELLVESDKKDKENNANLLCGKQDSN